MKKLLISFLITFSLLLQIAFAVDFTVDANIKEQYTAGYTDYITIKLNNLKAEESWFNINLLGSEKWIYFETTSGLIRVPSMGSESFKITVEPPKDIIPPNNPYNYILKITRVGGDELEKSLLINIVQTTNAIIKDLMLSCTECLDSISISGTVYNVGSKSLDLFLVLKAGDLQKTVSIGNVDIREKKNFLTTLSLKDMKPATYSLEVKLIDSVGKVMYTQSASFKIPVIENIVYGKEFSSTPFGSLVTVTATNKGNTESEADLLSVAPENWYSFISGPSPSGMMTGYYFWKTTLKPSESTTLKYTEIYWPTYVLIVAIVFAIVIVYWQSTAFTFKKRIIGKPNFKFGRDISISLHLKSKRRAVEKVAIRDIVPPNFTVVSKFETVKPLIRKIANGIELIWKVGNLNPNEERVLHYTIKPTIETRRKVHLPAALAKAASRKGLALKHSNRISLYPEKEPTKIVSVKISK